MTLGEKIRYLREVEGSLRGLNRPLTQQELMKGIQAETGKTISQSYLSQIETRQASAYDAIVAHRCWRAFSKCIRDFWWTIPRAITPNWSRDLRTTEGQLDVWLLQGSERFASDPEVSEVLIKMARDKDTRRCLLLLGEILNTPGLADRLFEALRPELARATAALRTKEAKNMTSNMTWADFYLICFAVGFLLSAISFIAGGLRWHLHLPHFPRWLWAADTLTLDTLRSGTRTASHGTARPHAGHQAPVSPFNFVTLTAFLAWFGGTGFLITRFSSIWFALGLLISMAAGLFGAGIVFLFLTRVLISHEENMDAADYEMVGVLGRISMPIRDRRHRRNHLLAGRDQAHLRRAQRKRQRDRKRRGDRGHAL